MTPINTDFETGRPVTMAPRGMVVSPHALASQAGVDALQAGGSAVDAALAASAALAVIYPHMTSVGGDAFWLIYDAARDRVRYLDGAGRAAAGASIGWFHARGLSEIPYRGVLPATLTVPGAVERGPCGVRPRPVGAQPRPGDRPRTGRLSGDGAAGEVHCGDAGGGRAG
jgi:gamma-glutamyltranspeptidase